MMLKTFSDSSPINQNDRMGRLIHVKSNVEDYEVSFEMRSRKWIKEQDSQAIRAPKYFFCYFDERDKAPDDKERPVIRVVYWKEGAHQRGDHKIIYTESCVYFCNNDGDTIQKYEPEMMTERVIK